MDKSHQSNCFLNPASLTDMQRYRQTKDNLVTTKGWLNKNVPGTEKYLETRPLSLNGMKTIGDLTQKVSITH